MGVQVITNKTSTSLSEMKVANNENISIDS